MVFHVDVGLAVPAFSWVALLVEFSARFEEGACAEDDVPAEEFAEGQQQGGSDTCQVMAVPLPVISQPPHINTRVPTSIDALVH